VRARLHVEFQGVLTTQAETGITFHYTIPHQGLLVADDGRIIFDLESGEALFAGSHDVIEQGFTAICPLLP
jgi:hypothetical protein